jgi:hypothetical protein
MTMTTTPTNSNRPSLTDLIDKADELGTLAARGADTQVQFYVTVHEAAFMGSIDSTKDKHGTGIDDATKLTEAYVKARTKASVFDHKAPNQRKAVSCVRSMVKLGLWPHGNSQQVLNDYLNIRAKLRANPMSAKRLDDAANAVLRLARRQVKEKSELDKQSLEAMLYKPVSEQRTVEEAIESLRKQTLNLLHGKSGLLDQSPLLKKAAQAFGDRLKEIAKEKGGTGSTVVASKAAAFSIPSNPVTAAMLLAE